MSPNDPPVDPADSARRSDAAGRAHGAAGPAGPAVRKRRRVVRLGAGDSTPSRITDDADVGWHESASDRTNDDQLRRDVPPHW